MLSTMRRQPLLAQSKSERSATLQRSRARKSAVRAALGWVVVAWPQKLRLRGSQPVQVLQSCSPPWRMFKVQLMGKRLEQFSTLEHIEHRRERSGLLMHQHLKVRWCSMLGQQKRSWSVEHRYYLPASLLSLVILQPGMLLTLLIRTMR